MSRYRILVSKDSLGNESLLRTLVPEDIDIDVRPLGPVEGLRLLTGQADAIIVALQPMRRPQIEQLADRVRVIGRAGVGLDTVDLDAACDRGIAVVHEPAYATNEVADHACALLLGIARQLVAADRGCRAGWVTSVDLPRISDLGQATLGIVGLGRIGSAVARRMSGFMGRIFGFDPAAEESAVEGVERTRDLHTLLRESHLVSLHAPLTPESLGLIGGAELAEMRPGAFLVNVSRGGLVDEDALAGALASGHLGGAALDVFVQEPLPAHSPLRRAPNTILTPHIAGYSDASAGRLARWMLDDVIAHLEGVDLPHGRYAVRPKELLGRGV